MRDSEDLEIFLLSWRELMALHTVGSDPIKFLLIIFWLLVGFGENALFKIHFNVTLLLLMNNQIWQSDEVIRKDVEIVEME